MDDLGLVKPVDRFGESIVVAIANTSDRRLDTCLRQSLGIANRHVLNTPVGVVHEAAAMSGTPIMKRLIQGIEDEGGMCRPANTPADYTPGKYVYDESDIDEALPGGDICEIRNPKLVQRLHLELTVHAVEWTGG